MKRTVVPEIAMAPLPVGGGGSTRAPDTANAKKSGAARTKPLILP
jgi:hypothetical protein